MNLNEKIYECNFDEMTESELISSILNDPDLPGIKSIVIGDWPDMYDSGPQLLFDMIVEHKEKFQHIESLFIGDVEFDVCEISWIVQGNYEALLQALPHLKRLTIKGSDQLELGAVNHQELEELKIICGGLPVTVVNSLKTAKLPCLKKLVLYLGVDDYGYDCDLTDFIDLAKKERFPQLTYLGFLNSKDQDELVRIILESDILPQLQIVDISCGCLTDKGGQMILDGIDKLNHLNKLNASYNYLSDRMLRKLRNQPLSIDVSDQQEVDDYENDDDDDDDDDYYDGMWPMITE